MAGATGLPSRLAGNQAARLRTPLLRMSLRGRRFSLPGGPCQEAARMDLAILSVRSRFWQNSGA